jgi:hypothetical protein
MAAGLEGESCGGANRTFGGLYSSKSGRPVHTGVKGRTGRTEYIGPLFTSIRTPDPLTLAVVLLTTLPCVENVGSQFHSLRHTPPV